MSPEVAASGSIFLSWSSHDRWKVYTKILGCKRPFCKLSTGIGFTRVITSPSPAAVVAGSVTLRNTASTRRSLDGRKQRARPRQLFTNGGQTSPSAISASPPARFGPADCGHRHQRKGWLQGSAGIGPGASGSMASRHPRARTGSEVGNSTLRSGKGQALAHHRGRRRRGSRRPSSRRRLHDSATPAANNLGKQMDFFSNDCDKAESVMSGCSHSSMRGSKTCCLCSQQEAPAKAKSNSTRQYCHSVAPDWPASTS